MFAWTVLILLVGKERVVGAREEAGVVCGEGGAGGGERGGGWSEGSGGDGRGGGAGVDRGIGGGGLILW